MSGNLSPGATQADIDRAAGSEEPPDPELECIVCGKAQTPGWEPYCGASCEQKDEEQE